MDDSGAILCQISSLKDMLDQVNEEIEASIQVTREIESEIVKCSEAESALSIRESELAKMVYMLDFEISGLISVTADSRTSAKHLEEDLRCLRMKCDEIVKRVNNMRDGFTTSCLDFQRNIDKGQNDVLRDLLSEKELLENELHLLSKKNNTLQNSMLAFAEEILEDLHGSNSDMVAEISRSELREVARRKDQGQKGESSSLPLAEKAKVAHNKKPAKRNVASFQPTGLETKCDLEMEKEKDQ